MLPLQPTRCCNSFSFAVCSKHHFFKTKIPSLTLGAGGCLPPPTQNCRSSNLHIGYGLSNNDLDDRQVLNSFRPHRIALWIFKFLKNLKRSSPWHKSSSSQTPKNSTSSGSLCSAELLALLSNPQIFLPTSCPVLWKFCDQASISRTLNLAYLQTSTV
jgi:hypothetical protein